jgi:hypothetical protein
MYQLTKKEETIANFFDKWIAGKDNISIASLL